MSKHIQTPFPSAREDVENVSYYPGSVQTDSPSYRLAYDDLDFVMRDELRPIRLQLELLKPELTLQEHQIDSTIVIFGSARINERKINQQKLIDCEKALAAEPDNPELLQNKRIVAKIAANSHYYEESRKLAGIITRHAAQNGNSPVIITGGGPGIMEAANRGADDVGGKSIGLNIVLPTEQHPNPYITPELCFQFHYFAIRKMHFLLRAKALVAFPGGFGTLDELFETLTLIQTKKIAAVPVILFGREYWNKIVNFQALYEDGMISEDDLNLIHFVESAGQAWDLIKENSSD